MTKQEMASYLASLSTLLAHQDAAGGTQRSQALSAEYDKYWALFKKKIKDESD